VVYEVYIRPGLKKYIEPLTEDKIAKLKHMIAMRNAGIEAYAAWPVDLVLDDKNGVCGFVMRKLSGYVPLHMIFSPMDRKKMFPDKGYNFLVHIARNLATAFYKLHEAGLVVGDVNEGNILINASGLVVFIDCDSFQVAGNDTWYYCEVGVPRYTPRIIEGGFF
jgi:DNA-binding helix-hairpin-helix protein with protein kinase domain